MKLPALAVRGILIDHTKADMESFYAVIPFSAGNQKRDAQQARAFVRFWNMTEEERVEVLRVILIEQADNECFTGIAQNILAAINGGGK